MQLEHQFTVPVPVAQAWDVLLDVERIAPCMPGATVESFDGETIVGRVKVKVGPIQVTYSRHREVHREGRGGPAGRHRGQRQGGARQRDGHGHDHRRCCTDDGGSSTNVDGHDRPGHHRQAGAVRPRRDGRGRQQAARPVRRLPGRQLGGGDAADSSSERRGRAGAGTQPPARSAGSRRRSPRRPPSPRRPSGRRPRQPAPSPAPTPLRRPVENDAIDLLDTAGLPVLKRVAPVHRRPGAVLLVFWRLVARRR